MMVLTLANRLSALLRELLRAQLGNRVNVDILEKALTLELRHFEDAEFYDKMQRARREASSRPLSMVLGVLGIAQSAITLGSYGFLLARLSAVSVVILVRREHPGVHHRGAHVEPVVSAQQLARARSAAPQLPRVGPHARQPRQRGEAVRDRPPDPRSLSRAVREVLSRGPRARAHALRLRAAADVAEPGRVLRLLRLRGPARGAGRHDAGRSHALRDGVPPGPERISVGAGRRRRPLRRRVVHVEPVRVSRPAVGRSHARNACTVAFEPPGARARNRAAGDRAAQRFVSLPGQGDLGAARCESHDRARRGDRSRAATTAPANRR